MKRLIDGFLEKTESVVSLSGKRVLEIGCGEGGRSVKIAERCLELVAIEPDPAHILVAKEHHLRPNISYELGRAESLQFGDEAFDIAFFTLSLHHVPREEMKRALQEAARVTKRGGFVLCLEPAQEGSFFEGELLFGAGDGDERIAKAKAYLTLLEESSSLGLMEVAELFDETIFALESTQDFSQVMHPKKNLDRLESFLEKEKFKLNAWRRLNIYKKR
ncbi:MAG: class I SAM-dependent methyltransferase [Patescibacteria group bacterium]